MKGKQCCFFGFRAQPPPSHCSSGREPFFSVPVCCHVANAASAWLAGLPCPALPCPALPCPALPAHSEPGATRISSLIDRDLRETPFLSNLCISTIILPRQARDKHRKHSKKRWRFSHRGSTTGVCNSSSPPAPPGHSDGENGGCCSDCCCGWRAGLLGRVTPAASGGGAVGCLLPPAPSRPSPAPPPAAPPAPAAAPAAAGAC